MAKGSLKKTVKENKEQLDLATYLLIGFAVRPPARLFALTNINII